VCGIGLLAMMIARAGSIERIPGIAAKANEGVQPLTLRRRGVVEQGGPDPQLRRGRTLRCDRPVRNGTNLSTRFEQP
jgi:hypothetical protein